MKLKPVPSFTSIFAGRVEKVTFECLKMIEQYLRYLKNELENEINRREDGSDLGPLQSAIGILTDDVEISPPVQSPQLSEAFSSIDEQASGSSSGVDTMGGMSGEFSEGNSGDQVGHK